MKSVAPLHGDTKASPISPSQAVAVPVVADVYTGSPQRPPTRTSCKQLQNEWELQLLQMGDQSASGLQTPPPSQPPLVAQPLVAVLEGSLLPEGPSLTVRPPEDPLVQPQQAAQPPVAVDQGSPLKEGPPPLSTTP